MAATKANSANSNAVTLTASAGDTTSSAVDLTTTYSASLGIKITNGATGPTVPAQVIVQVSYDNSKWYNLGGALVASTANSAVTSWVVNLPDSVQRVRTVSGSNTGQNVTLDVDVGSISAI
jgi:hypothetical protein